MAVKFTLSQKTVDGKQTFHPETSDVIPPPVEGKTGERHNTSYVEKDELGINRPKRGWLMVMYGSVADLMRRR